MSRLRKAVGFSLLGVALATLAGPGCVVVSSEQLGDYQREFNLTEALPPEGRLELKAYKGDIRITGWEKPEVEVRAVVRAENLFWGEREWEETEVVAERWGDTVRIRARYPKRRGIFVGINVSETPSIDYEIHMPRRARLELKDHKSVIHLNELEGRLRLNTYKGDVFLEGFRGGLELETYKGTAHLAIPDLTGDSSIETYKGDVHVRVNPEDDFRFEVDLGRRADFHSDFPLETGYGSYRRKKWERLYGVVGTGRGPRLTFESYKGTLTLTR